MATSGAGIVPIMNSSSLLTFLSVVASLVGGFAVLRPVSFLASKGATITPVAAVWMREVGVLIFAQGVTAFLMRNQPVTPALRAFLVGAAVTQFGLLPIELAAYRKGTLTKLSGVVPNSVLHLVLGAALLVQALA